MKKCLVATNNFLMPAVIDKDLQAFIHGTERAKSANRDSISIWH